MLTGTAQVVRANARHLPLADDSVDLVVTSPPYFALRSYQDGGEHYAGQVGDEPTPAAFVASLLEVTRECVRVTKPSGSIWINLGDKYSGGRSGPQGETGQRSDRAQAVTYGTNAQTFTSDVRHKSLIGIPWRYALACIDDLGLILRAEVIWSKPNGLPESVTDRVRRSHEQWFHFTLAPRYYSAVDEIREEHAPGAHARRADGMPTPKQAAGLENGTRRGYMPETYTNPLGKLPGSVWTIPTQPLQVPAHLGVDHFAAFPMEWPRRIIQGWSPAGVCTACGEGRRPVTRIEEELLHVQRRTRGFTDMSGASPLGSHGAGDGKRVTKQHATITGYACACPEPTAPTAPGVVLDPFGGTGTTALVAKTLGRHGITIDMSADYCRLAEWRTNDPDQMAQAMQVEKPPRQVAGQDALFDVDEPPPKAATSVSLQGDRTCRTCGYRSQYARKPACDKCGTPREAAS